MSDGMTLYTNKMCPFAQKAWITLEEKKATHGLEFKLEEIGLYGSGGKPDWFLKLNPKGEVPVLKHGDKVVVESDEIIKYIDAATDNPFDLSRGKGASVDDWFQILEKVRSAGKDCILGYGSMERLNEVLCKVEKMIEGPFMRGDFSLADIAAAPFFQRMMTEQKKLGLAEANFPKIYAWWQHVRIRPSVANTVVSSWWWWW